MDDKQQIEKYVKMEINRIEKEAIEHEEELKELIIEVVEAKIESLEGQEEKFNDIADLYYGKGLTALAHKHVMLAKAKRELVNMLRKLL